MLTYTHITINMIFLCLLNFQVLEAPIVLSGCIISRFSSHKCVYPSSSAHICKRETHRCFTRGALTSSNSDFFNCTDIISQCRCTCRSKQLHTETYREWRWYNFNIFTFRAHQKQNKWSVINFFLSSSMVLCKQCKRSVTVFKYYA